MGKNFSFFAFLLVMVFTVGCASTNGYLPKYAITDPAKGISVPHPVEAEKEVKKTGEEMVFTTFTAMMSTDLWTELADGGGVFPILGRSENSKELLKGYCYAADINWWGDFLLQCVYARAKATLENVKFAIFNKDAGWAYKLNGREAYEPAEEGIGKKFFKYEPSKLEKDGEYQKEFFEKFGMTLKESDEFFKSYFTEKGLEAADDLTSVSEIVVGSEQWEEYKAKLAARFPNNYKMADGSIRSGTLPLEDFKLLAVENPGFTGGARFADDLNIPLIALPLTGAALPVMIAASLAATAVSAGVDDSWSGYFGRAKIIRHDMAPSFDEMSKKYKSLLKKRDEQMKELKNALEEQQLIVDSLQNR